MSFKQKFYYVCGQICSKCVGKFCEKCTSRLSFSVAHLPPSPCYYLPQVFYSLYFFRIKILESCPCHPSSLALNPPVPVYHTITTTTTTSSSTTSVPVNIYYTTTTTTTTHSSTTSSVHAPSPVTAPPSATAGGGVPTYLTDMYAIVCYILGAVLSLLSVVIFWVRKTCKSSRQNTSHNTISLVSLSCPSPLPPPPILSPSLVSTNPFLSSSSSNPFLTSSV